MSVYVSMASILLGGLLVSCASVGTQAETQNPDEQAIVRLIEGIVAAFNSRDLEAELAVYAPEAMIESLVERGAPMSRDQYASLRQTWTPRGTVYLRDVYVNLLSADEARAIALFRLVDGDHDILGRRSHRLVRRTGQWLIVDARFVGPIPWDRK